jgi:regulator of protease activity HflC (stomatin/prohibitin superfamily)
MGRRVVLMLGIILGGITILIFLLGIRIVRPVERGVIETFGKYSRFVTPGFNWIIPIIQRMITVNITEMMKDIQPQDIITKDNLNARVDLITYYKVRATEENVKKSLYNVSDYENQIVSLAQTTARNVIGEMIFEDVNNKRNILNEKLREVMDTETDAWGIEIVRVELKEITPPEGVQKAMNQVVVAARTKDAAVDYATAEETKADGTKRAEIKKAEGIKQGRILVAEGKAQAIEKVNTSANKYFKGNAKDLKKLEVMETFKDNSKIILGDNANGILKLLDVDKTHKK